GWGAGGGGGRGGGFCARRPGPGPGVVAGEFGAPRAAGKAAVVRVSVAGCVVGGGGRDSAAFRARQPADPELPKLFFGGAASGQESVHAEAASAGVGGG